MSTSLLDHVEVRPSSTAAQRLRTTMATVRLSFMWFGVRKSLSPQQKALAAESFGAEGEYLSAGKKLLDTKHPAFRSVTSVRGKVQAIWKGQTLPYPEPGIRLIRQDGIEAFRQLFDGRNLVGNAGGADLRFATDDALRDGGRSGQKSAGDFFGRETADFPKRHRYLRAGSEGRVAAGEDES